MDFAARKHLYNLINPDEPLDPSDPRNVDIDSLPGNVRGGNFVDDLVRKIVLADAPTCTFVTAQRGAGLTTELRRLDSRISAQDGAHLIVVHVAAEEFVDMSSPLHSADLLFAIWARTEEVVTKTIGKPISDHTRRFWKWLTQTEVHVTDVSLPGLVAGLVATAQWEPQTLQTMRGRFESDRLRILDEIRSELVLLQDRVKHAGYGGLVVIVDGLNRLHGLSTNRTEVMNSAERVYAQEIPQWRLPIPIVMTTPSVMLLRPNLHIEFLSYIPWGAELDGKATTAILRILRGRMRDFEFDQIFGNDRAIDRWGILSNTSAGCIGDMLRLLRECLLVDAMDEAKFQRVISQFCDRWRRLATRDVLHALVEVHRTGSLESMDRAMAEEAMSSHFVVRYAFDGRFRVHPALLERLPQ